MMRAARRVSLLPFSVLAFSLLISAGTAHAACAWVLWSTFPTASEPRIEYRPSESFEKKAECDAAKLKIEQKQRDDFMDYATRGLQDKYIQSSWNHRCLPDTVDPRGPKGK